MALRSIHRPVRGPFAAAAACGWRRLLANQSSGLSEDDVERIVNKRMSEIFSRGYDPEGKELVRTIREIVKEEGDSMKPSQAVIMFVEDTANKETIKYNQKLSDQTEHFEEKSAKIIQQQEDFTSNVDTELEMLQATCLERAQAADSKVASLKEQHENFSETSMHEVRKTQYNIVKIAVGVGVVIAAVGFVGFVAFHSFMPPPAA